MAIILQFRRPAEPAARLWKPTIGVLGQIIIFPGVRIDRLPPRRRRGEAIYRLAQRDAAKPQETAALDVTAHAPAGGRGHRLRGVNVLPQ